jgi:hypothetical protein
VKCIKYTGIAYEMEIACPVCRRPYKYCELNTSITLNDIVNITKSDDYIPLQNNTTSSMMNLDMSYDHSKDPKIDTSLMSRDEVRNFYADEAKALQLIRNGHKMLESEDIKGAASKFEEALLLLHKYEKYQKKKEGI